MIWRSSSIELQSTQPIFVVEYMFYHMPLYCPHFRTVDILNIWAYSFLKLSISLFNRFILLFSKNIRFPSIQEINSLSGHTYYVLVVKTVCGHCSFSTSPQVRSFIAPRNCDILSICFMSLASSIPTNPSSLKNPLNPGGSFSFLTLDPGFGQSQLPMSQL